MRPPEPPLLPDELTAVLSRLRLPYIRRAAPEVLATARAQRWDHAETLRVLLVEEAAGRDAATKATRRRAAGFPSGKTLESWRESESAIPLPTQHALATLEWLSRAESLVLAGPSGTGKTHWCEALAAEAIEQGRPGGGRGLLPGRGRRLQAAQRGGDLQPPSVRGRAASSIVRILGPGEQGLADNVGDR